MNPLLRFLFVGSVLLVAARGETSAPIPASTFSPDQRYGVTVPPSDPDSWGFNKLVEMKSGRVLGEINAPTAFARMNRAILLPAWWSEDDTSLLWQVEGKWGMDTQILVRLKNGEIDWELDVLAVLRRAILTRAEATDPRKFLANKKWNWSAGSAYPEKFVIDSQAERATQGPLKFPIRFRVFLASDVKHIDRDGIDASLWATLDEDGMITVTDFRLGRDPAAPWYQVQEDGDPR